MAASARPGGIEWLPDFCRLALAFGLLLVVLAESLWNGYVPFWCAFSISSHIWQNSPRHGSPQNWQPRLIVSPHPRHRTRARERQSGGFPKATLPP